MISLRFGQRLSSVFVVPRLGWLLSLFTLGIGVPSAQSLNPDLRPDSAAPPRVVIVTDHRATATYRPQTAPLRQMVERGLSRLWRTPSAAAGWRQLISANDVVGIRVHSSTGKTSGTRPEVVAAVVESLLASGHPARQVVVWDRSMSTLRAAGYLALKRQFNIDVVGAREFGYDGSAFYESSLIGTMVWGDHEFGVKGEGIGRKSYVSKLLTQRVTKIINITPLLNHNRAGVFGNLVGLALASVDNTIRFQSTAGRLAVAVPEINALPEVGDRVVLNIVDALIAQYQGETQGRLQDSAVLNQLRFSADPVALDVLSIADLEKQRALKNIDSLETNRTLYENASLLQLGMSDLDQIVVESIR